MMSFSLSHLTDGALRRDLAALVATDRATTASLLAHLAEVDRRRLYCKLRYDSLFEYCLRELKLSEDAAAQRIQAARIARSFPAIFAMLADGRLHLSAVRLLAPHLTRANAAALLAAAERKTRREVEDLLAERFARPDLPTLGQPDSPVPTPVSAVAPAGEAPVADTRTAIALPASELAAPRGPEHAPGHVESGNPLSASVLAGKSVHVAGSGAVGSGAGAPRDTFTARGRIIPLSAQRVAVQVSVSRATHEKLGRATDLLAHVVPKGELAEVLDRALDALLAKLERRKFGATDRPRAAGPGSSNDPRYISRDLRRAVAKRDGRQCTYVGSGGRRCGSRRKLEYDHIVPVAHGGQATLANLRLRCRAHNQLEAEQIFGAQHMQARREQSAHARSTSPPAP